MVAELEKEPVFVVPYDPLWREWFLEDREQLLIIFGEAGIAVEHIGSTAVPGLAAKPIIDILVGARSMSERSSFISALVATGYTYIPEYEKLFPERLFFYRRRPHACNVHWVQIDSDFWRRHLLFRDFLRRYPDVCRDYAALKENLAVRFRHDRQGYLAGKKECIRAWTVAAEAEQSRGLIK